MGPTVSLGAVEAWFDRVSSSATGSSFASIHIDELLPEPFARAPLDTSLAAFGDLARRVEESGEEQLALVVISLTPSSRLLRTPPQVVRPSWLRQSPPALYLCGQNLWSVWGNDEEYRVPVQPTWFSSPRGRVHFRVHRDERAQHSGWEFERSFYVHSGFGW